MTDDSTSAAPPAARPERVAETAAPQRATPREIFVVYAGFMVVMALAALDQSIVATALPRIVSDLGGVTHISWVVTAYVLASIAAMPLYGKLSDQYGRKPLVYASVGIFLVGSVLSGLAESMGQLIAFRAIQGIGAGGMIPMGQIVIADLIPPRERGKYQGNIGIVFAVASVLGPAIGGIVTDALSWHWIFYINLPIGIIAFFMIAVTLRPSKISVRRSIDYLGAFLLTCATTCLMLVLSLGGTQYAWASWEILGLAAGGAIFSVLFVLRERVAPEPVMALGLFKQKVFVIGILVVAATFMAMQSASTFFPLFFQVVLGIKVTNSGLLTAPMVVGIVISAKANGRYVYLTGRYKRVQLMSLGLAVIAFATLAWAAATSQPIALIEPTMVAVGLGVGLVNPNMMVAVQNASDTRNIGASTGAMSFFRSLGGAMGVAISGAILARELQASLATTTLPAGVRAEDILGAGIVQIQALPPEAHAAVIDLYRQAISTCFSVSVLWIVIALALSLLMPEMPLRTKMGSGRLGSGRLK